MPYEDYGLPTPVTTPPNQKGLWGEVDRHAQQEAQEVLPGGITEPSPWGTPVKRAEAPPEPTRESIAPEQPKPRARTVRRGKPPVVPTAPVVQEAKEKKRFTIPKLPKVSLKKPDLVIPDQLHALFTPTACAIAAWSVASHLIGAGTQGIVAMSVMTAMPLVLLWFMFDVLNGKLRVKLGVYGLVLTAVSLMFSTLVTIAPYSVMALATYWLYFPSVRGWLRRLATWFCASAIAWSITIFL